MEAGYSCTRCGWRGLVTADSADFGADGQVNFCPCCLNQVQPIQGEAA